MTGHNLPPQLLPPAQRVGREMAGGCCLTPKARIVHRDAKTGTIRQCALCKASYVNDHGVWRNLLTVDPRRLAHLQVPQNVDTLIGKDRS